MDSSDVLQIIPDFKIARSVSSFNLLVVSKANSQLVRHSLLSQFRRFAGIFQIIPH